MDVTDLIALQKRDITACFTGHRVIPSASQSRLNELMDHLLLKVYAMGYRIFLCGGALGFDTLAAFGVLRLKARFSDVILCMIRPCESQSDRWSAYDQMIYQKICADADLVYTLSSVYYEGCMLTRNKFMIDHSSLCIAWMLRSRGGTAYTVQYALESKIEIINLAMPRYQRLRMASGAKK